MNQYSILIIFLFTSIILISCNTEINTQNSNESKVEKKSTELVVEEESKVQEENLLEDERNEQDIALEHHINYLKETWKDTPNPIIAKYAGTDMGDYFHFEFIDEKEQYYDFADGNNDLGDFELIIDRIEHNEKYVGKQFEIKWEWRMSEFLCCDGMMEVVETEVPSIIGLKLID